MYELNDYIIKHKHLPEIPSATEAVKNGVDIGEFQAKLLMKIEELTLNVIEQQKEIDKLKTQVNKK